MPVRISERSYPHGRGVRFRISTGPSTHYWAKAHPEEARARRFAEALAEVLQEKIDLTVGGLCVRYLGRLAVTGSKPSTISSARAKLALLFGDYEGDEVVGITVKRAANIYQKLVDAGGATATHHNALNRARSVWRWAKRQGIVTTNPWLEVEKIGRAKRGKKQLRIDEARRLADVCAKDILTDDGALAVMMALLMGLRTSEIEKRTVRDVDQDCTVLVIEDTKTRHGERQPEIPEELRDAIRLRCQGRAPEAPLLRTITGQAPHDKFVAISLRRYCNLAKVPQVCPHGLRGGFASALVEAGALTHLVAAVMGHGSFEAVTARHYATPDAMSKAAAKKRAQHLKLV